MNSVLQPNRGHNLRLRVIASTAECGILLKQAHCLFSPRSWLLKMLLSMTIIDAYIVTDVEVL